MANAKKSKTTDYGLGHAIEALAGLDPQQRERLLARIRQSDPEIAEKLNQRMFQFEDLQHTTERSLSEFLRTISDGVLALALRGASETLLKKVWAAFSQRKAEMLRQQIQQLGPQPLRKVEEARESIMALAKDWIDSGKLVVEKSDQWV